MVLHDERRRSYGKRAAEARRNESCAIKRFAHFPLETEMTKSPTILTRRSMFRAGAGLALVATATPLLASASARAEGAKPMRNH